MFFPMPTLRLPPAAVLFLALALPMPALAGASVAEGWPPPGLYLDVAARAGYPRGLGGETRLVAWLYALEAGCAAGHDVTGCRLGGGFRVGGERRELFLLVAHEWVLRESRPEPLERGVHLDLELARVLGRSRLSAFVHGGMAMHPYVAGDLGQIVTRYAFGIGVRKRLLGR